MPSTAAPTGFRKRRLPSLLPSGVAVAMVVAGVNVAALAVAAGAAEVATPSFTEEASAVWREPLDGHRYRAYAVEVTRRVAGGGASTTVSVADVTCTRAWPPSGAPDDCAGTVATVKPTFFKVDATLRTWRVRWPSATGVHEVTWTGQGAPELFRHRAGLDGEDAGARLYQQRRATVAATLPSFAGDCQQLFSKAHLGRQVAVGEGRRH